MGVLDTLLSSGSVLPEEGQAVAPLDADQELSFIQSLGKQSVIDDAANAAVNSITEPARLAAHIQTTQKPKSVLEQQVTWQGTKEISRGLLKSADEALIREGGKPGLQIFLDTMSLVPRAVKALGESIGTQAAEISLDPYKALPAAASFIGGVAGAVTGNPALAYAGGVAGRTLGKYLQDWHEGRNFGTYDDVLDIAGSLTGTNLTAAPVGGVIRLGLKKAGVDVGRPLGLGLSKNIVERSKVLTNPEGPTAQKVAAIIKDAAEVGQALRNDAYAKAKEMKLYSEWGGQPIQQVLDDTTVPTKKKQQFIDELMSIEEDTRLARGTLGLSQSELLPSQRMSILQTTQKDRTLLVNSVLQPSTLRKERPELPLETKAGQRRRLLEYTQQQEAERIGSQAWVSSINDIVKDSVESLRTVLGLTPELINTPIIHELKNSFAWIPQMFDTQVGFRKSGNALLQHMGDILLHANETARVASRATKDNAAALFEKYALNDEHIMHLAGLQSKGDIMAAYDSAKKNIPLFIQDQEKRGIQNLTPDDLLTQEVQKAAKQAGYEIHPTEVKDFMHALNFMDEWRHQVADPLYGIAHTLNPDPKWLAIYNPTYFLPTNVQARHLADAQHQVEMLRGLMDNVDATTELGKIQLKRYEESFKAATNKLKVAQTAQSTIDHDLSNIYSMIAEKGVKATKTFMGSFLPSSKRMQLFSSNPKLAAEEYIDGFLRKSVYDNAMPKAHEVLQQFIDSNIDNPAKADAVKRAASWAQGVMLDQYELRKNAKLQNISNMLAGTPLGNGGFEKAVDFMTKTHYMLNIALKPRFYGLNALQNVTGLLPQVDTESYAHGISQWFFNRENAIKEARLAGILEPEQFQTQELRKGLFTAADPERMANPSTFEKVVDNVSHLADVSENMNRVIAYHAGLHHAEMFGLQGHQARMKAMDIVKDAHYLYDVANRPSVSNTPIGGLMTRYTTFSKNYASFLSHQIRSGDVSRIGSSIAGLLAVSGSKGIPLYGMVQAELAKLGHDDVLPDVPAVDQVFGLDLGSSTGLLPDIPTSLPQVLGVFYKEGQNVVETLSNDQVPLDVRGKAAALGVLGSPIRNLISAAQEYQAGGVTTSPQGTEVKSVREPRDIVLSGLGLKPTPRALQAEANERLKLAMKAQNAGYLNKEIQKLQNKGVTNSEQILRRIAAKQRSGENTTALQLLTDIPNR